MVGVGWARSSRRSLGESPQPRQNCQPPPRPSWATSLPCCQSVPGGSLLYSMYTEPVGQRESIALEGYGPIQGAELCAKGREWTTRQHSGTSHNWWTHMWPTFNMTPKVPSIIGALASVSVRTTLTPRLLLNLAPPPPLWRSARTTSKTIRRIRTKISRSTPMTTPGIDKQQKSEFRISNVSRSTTRVQKTIAPSGNNIGEQKKQQLRQQ